MTLQKGHKAALVKKGAVLWLVYFIHHAAQFIYKKKTLKLLVLSETVLVSIGKEGWGLGGGGGRTEGGK